MDDRETPIDWDDCWASELTDYDEGWSYEMAHGIAETLDQFFEKVGVPESIVSVGCGPAISLLDLAGVHPDSHFSGYDISQTVLNEARTRRDERGLRNVSFAVDRLPKLQTDRTFDLVYCFATLHYVADSETAIRSLWERVAPDGHLIVNYPTPDHEEWMENHVTNPEEVGLDGKGDDWVENRVRLVLDGVNTLTERGCHRTVTTPKSRVNAEVE